MQMPFILVSIYLLNFCAVTLIISQLMNIDCVSFNIKFIGCVFYFILIIISENYLFIMHRKVQNAIIQYYCPALFLAGRSFVLHLGRQVWFLIQVSISETVIGCQRYSKFTCALNQ